MKEIGLILKETRETNGVSIEEAAEDLKLRPSQIENIESGNIKAFSDIFYLKYFIRDYAKYLGLEPETLIDEFNEFLFDYTSKIPVDDLKKVRANTEKEEKAEEKKISSPYTKRVQNSNRTKIILFVIVFIIILVGLIYYLIK